MSCSVGLDVGLEPVLAQRRARHRADRDDAAGRSASPAACEEEAHRRGRGEGDVVGVRAAAARARRRAARRPSRTARATSTSAPRSRSASGSTSRASCGAGDQRAGDRDVRAAPRRSDSATDALGHDVGLDAALAQRRARCPGRWRRGRCRRARGRPPSTRSNSSAHAVGARSGRRGRRRSRSGSVGVRAARCGSRAPRRPRRPSARSRAGELAGLRAGPGHGDGAAVQRAVLEPGERARAGRRPSPTTVIAGGGCRPPRRASAIVASVAATVRWPGERAALDHRRGLVGRRARRRSAARRSRGSRLTPM